MTTPGDRAAATVQVAVSIEDAFDVFTSEIDLWWRMGRKFRIAGRRPGRLVFEPGLDGRLFETVTFDSRQRTFEVGRVIEWDPPRRLALEWRGVNFRPHEKTLVEVTFTAVPGGTMVRVEHSGWSTLPDDHPARHGRVGPAFSRSIGMWWGELLTSLREHAGQRKPSQ